MIAKVTDLEPGDFVHTLGDAHLYLNHLEQTDEQLSRSPKELPNLVIHKDAKELEDFVFEDFEIVDYEADPHISAPVAV